MLCILLLIAVIAGVLWSAHFVYCLAFLRDVTDPNDPYGFLPDKQQAIYALQIQQNIRALLAVPCEEVKITTRDGVCLVGRYYHRKDGAPVQIQFHGYRGNSIREYSGTFRMSEMLGINTLVADMRSHGNSAGKTITLGIRERCDCAEWVQYVVDRFGENVRIILTGASMGAATVLMASELDIAHHVKGIIADSPYSSPKSIIQRVGRFARIPSFLTYPIAMLGALLFGGFRLWQSSAVKAVQNTTIPILLIHGDADGFVPYRMSFDIFQSCKGPKRLAIFSGAGHCLSYYTDCDRYLSEIRDFLKSCTEL